MTWLQLLVTPRFNVVWSLGPGKWEGGEAFRPPEEDPGGWTNRGVIKSTCDALAPKIFGQACTDDFFRGITEAQALEFGRDFWNYVRGSEISDPCVSMVTFYLNWGSGPGGLMVLQNYLGVPMTGTMTDETLKVLNTKGGDEMLTWWRSFWASLPNAGYNPGWFNLIDSVKNEVCPQLYLQRNLKIGAGALLLGGLAFGIYWFWFRPKPKAQTPKKLSGWTPPKSTAASWKFAQAQTATS